MISGPHDLGGTVEIEPFLIEKQRSERWKFFESLSFPDKEFLTGI